MNKERLKFFVTCPSCKRKFGITPETVFKYVDRILTEIARELQKREQDLKKWQEKGESK